MTGSIRIDVSAKINLHLRVLERNPDGFHGIESLFQAVGLTDSIAIRSLKTTGISVEGDFGCRPEATTVFRAAAAFMQETEIDSGLRIEVEKRIPARSGLGGGSADAAGLLEGLDLLFETGLGAERLAAIGARIGSDVPFFLGGGTAIVTGRGEKTRDIAPRADLGIVLAFPGFGSSTVAAYAELDAARAAGLNPVRRFIPSADCDECGDGECGDGECGIESEYRKAPDLWRFFNDFQEVLAAGNATYGLLLDALTESGARFSALSGSGSSMFGVFLSPEEADDAAERLASRFISSGRSDLPCFRAVKTLASPLAQV